MAHMAAIVEAVAVSGSNLSLSGSASIVGGMSVQWSASVAASALAATINAAVRDAAIAQLEAENTGLTVGALDNKSIFAGVVGL